MADTIGQGPIIATTAHQTLATNTTLTRTEFDSGTFVEALRKKLIVLPLGRRNDIPRHSGNVMRWQYFASPTGATTALTEGVDPTNSHDIDTTAVTATIKVYGDFFELTDVFEIATISGTRQEFVKAAGYQAGLTLDTLCLTALADASSTNNAGTAIKASDLSDAARYLSGGNVEDHPMAAPGRWAGVFSSECVHDLANEGVPTWYQAKAGSFNNGMQSVPTTGGAGATVHDVTIRMSTNIITASSDDQNYVMGKDAFGVTSLASNIMKPEILIVPASPSLASPLGVRSTIGWKARFATEVIHNVRLKEILSDQS